MTSRWLCFTRLHGIKYTSSLFHLLLLGSVVRSKNQHARMLSEQKRVETSRISSSQSKMFKSGCRCGMSTIHFVHCMRMDEIHICERCMINVSLPEYFLLKFQLVAEQMFVWWWFWCVWLTWVFVASVFVCGDICVWTMARDCAIGRLLSEFTTVVVKFELVFHKVFYKSSPKAIKKSRWIWKSILWSVLKSIFYIFPFSLLSFLFSRIFSYMIPAPETHSEEMYEE